MRVDKIIMNITIEVLSIDSVLDLLGKMYGEIESEMIEGKLRADDGDTIEWAINRITEQI